MTPEQKTARVARAEDHREKDRLIAGEYIAEDGVHGCSVGCDAIDIGASWAYDNLHATVAEHDGTPVWLEFLRDEIFEGLPPDRRADWHVSLAKALPVDVDFQPYYHRISIRICKRLLDKSDTWNEGIRLGAAGAITVAIDYHKSPTRFSKKNARVAIKNIRYAILGDAWTAAETAAHGITPRVKRCDYKAPDDAVLCAEWTVNDTLESAVWIFGEPKNGFPPRTDLYVWLSEMIIEEFQRDPS